MSSTSKNLDLMLEEKSVGPKRRAAKSRVPKRRGQVFQKAIGKPYSE